jgi:bifunctional non-homologous end joining protein LigD
LSRSFGTLPTESGRSQSWINTRLVKRETLTIIGFATNPGDQFRSLHVARRVGKRLVYAGQVGTGFKARDRAQIMKRLGRLSIDEPALPVPVQTARIVG